MELYVPSEPSKIESLNPEKLDLLEKLISFMKLDYCSGSKTNDDNIIFYLDYIHSNGMISNQMERDILNSVREKYILWLKT